MRATPASRALPPALQRHPPPPGHPRPAPLSRFRRSLVFLAAVVAVCATVRTFAAAASPPVADPPEAGIRVKEEAEAAYLAETDAAMQRMMREMAIAPTGDVDRDFVAAMTPHHQSAIDMARAYLRYGGNEPLRRLAQEIIVTQQQEIAVMRQAVGAPLPPAVPPGPRPSPGTP